MADQASPPRGPWSRLQAHARTLANADAVAEAGGELSRTHHFAHFWVLTAQLFVRNRGPVRAASLAYTTLLALVPLLAISISAITLFLPKEEAERQARLAEWIEAGVTRVAPTLGLSGQGGEEQRVEIADKIVSFVERIHFGKITATAAAGLIIVAIGLLRTIEVAFNDIWGVTRGRSLLLSVVFYWAIITLGPAVVLVAKGANYLSFLGRTGAGLETSTAGQFFWQLAVVASPLLMALAFGALYLWMPNTRVRWKAALVGGLVASVLWTINGKLGALYNTKVLTYNAIYGSLGALPIFLVGMYLTWLIVLFGAQVSYVFQNRKAYLQERIAGRVHQQGREFAALRLMTLVAERFISGQPPAGIALLAEQLCVPPHLAKELVRGLVAAGLLNEVSGGENLIAPARPPAQVTVRDVLNALRTSTGSDLATANDPQRPVVAGALEEVRAAEDAASDAITLEALARQGGAEAVGKV